MQMMNKNKWWQDRERLFEAAFLLGIFLFYFIWAWYEPYDTAPDEEMRYAIPRFIFETGRLPLGEEPALRNEIWGISYAFNPILSYMIAAVFMKAVSIFTASEFALLMAARMVSILFGLGMVWLTILISRKLFTGWYRWPFICLVALLPQASYLMTYVNNDSMALFSTALIIYMWLLGMETDWDMKSCTGLAIGVSICLLSYYNAYGFVLCSIFFFAVTCGFCGKEGRNLKRMWKLAGYITLVTVILAGWWFIRMAILYDGDFLGMSASSHFAELYAQEPYKPSNRMTLQKQGASIFNMLFSEGWIYSTQNSFVGRFGYAEKDLPGPLYFVYLTVIKLGIMGVVLRFSTLFKVREKGQWIKKNIFHVTMAVSIIIPPVLSMYYSYTSDFQPQGRYIMPLLIPAMYFTIVGLTELLSPFVKERNLKRMCIGYSLILGVCAIFIFTKVFLPMYY